MSLSSCNCKNWNRIEISKGFIWCHLLRVCTFDIFDISQPIRWDGTRVLNTTEGKASFGHAKTTWIGRHTQKTRWFGWKAWIICHPKIQQILAEFERISNWMVLGLSWFFMIFHGNYATDLHHVSPGFIREVPYGSQPPSLVWSMSYVIKTRVGKLGFIGDDLIQLN